MSRMPRARRRLVGRLAEAEDRRRGQRLGIDPVSAVLGRIVGQQGLGHELADVGVRVLGQQDQLVGRRRPSGQLPSGQLQRQVAERLAGLREQGLDPIEAEELGGDLGAGVDGPVGLGQGDVGMMAEDVLDGEPAERGVGRAGGDGHLPEPLGTGEGIALRCLRRVAGEHLQERGLRDDPDVRAGRVELLALELLRRPSCRDRTGASPRRR